MRKIILMFVLLVSCSALFAQKVKVKKGIILVDKNKVAKIEKNKNIYKVSNLEGKVLFSAEVASKTIKGNPTKDLWLRFTGTNENIREIERTNTSFTFSSEKIITRNLVVGPAAFLSTSGIDTSLINDFFSKTDTGISNKFDSIYDSVKEKHQKEDKIAKELKLHINKQGEVCIDKNIIGKFLKKITKESNEITYIVVDLKNFPVAVATFSSSSTSNPVLEGTVLKTYDQREHTINAIYTSDKINEDKLANRIVKMLYADDYKIEEAQEESKRKYSEDYENALKNSVNIFNVHGYILNEKGEKKEGVISIPYENIKAKIRPDSESVGLLNYGGVVYVKNAEGKTKIYRAENAVSVFIGDRTFVGAHGVGDSNVGDTPSISLIGKSPAQFFEVAYKTKLGYILHHPKNPEYYYIMLKGNNKAYYLGDKGFLHKKPKEKIEKLFNEAVNCSALNFTDYDTLSKEGMIKILDDYTEKCSK